jgi:hypothetical protein
MSAGAVMSCSETRSVLENQVNCMNDDAGFVTTNCDNNNVHAIALAPENLDGLYSLV